MQQIIESGITESCDPDHFNAQPGQWQVDVDQLSQGPFNSRIRFLKLPGITVYDNRWGCASLVSGESPPDMLMIGADAHPETSTVRWCGRKADRRLFACAVAIRNGLTGSHPRCMKSHGRDGGIMALRSLPAGAGSKPPRAALAEDRCRERRGKRRTHVVRQVWIKKANTSEPPYRRRYAYNDIKTGSANSPGTSP